MLAVFDMDGVLIEESSSWRLLHKAFGTDNSKVVKMYREGLIDDLQFLNEDIRIWREHGIRKEDIERVCNSIPLMPGIKECMDFFRKRGKLAIISGGIDTIARRIATYGVNYVFANGILYRGNIPWKGILRVPIRRKERVLRKLMEEIPIDGEDVVVIGDSIYDAGMMKMAGMAIAFNPRHEDIKEYADYVVEKKNLREVIKIFK